MYPDEPERAQNTVRPWIAGPKRRHHLNGQLTTNHADRYHWCGRQGQKPNGDLASPLVPTVVVMPELYLGRRLDRPRSAGLRRPTIDPDSFAHFSERVARFLGTSRYLLIQTIIVAIWMRLNVAAVAWRFDPYPFILLNLVFSAQAADQCR